MRYRVSFWNPKVSSWVGIACRDGAEVDEVVSRCIRAGMETIRIRPQVSR